MSEIDLEAIRGTMKTPGVISFFNGLGYVLPLCDEAERLRARVKELEGEPCNWTEDENGNWNTDCGNCFVLEAETPCENEMKFCAYCGKTLTETRFAYDDEEGDAKP